ncbi:hypothetical protein OROMI_010214 [Orobanche minor]
MLLNRSNLYRLGFRFLVRAVKRIIRSRIWPYPYPDPTFSKGIRFRIRFGNIRTDRIRRRDLLEGDLNPGGAPPSYQIPNANTIWSS